MASVRLKSGSDFWFACFKLPTGATGPNGLPIYKRVQRSTGTADKATAKQIAATYEKAATSAGNKQWQESAARQFLAEITALTGQAVPQSEPVESFLTRWEAARASSLSPSSRMRYNSVLRDFLRSLGPQSVAPLAQIGPAQVAIFRDAEITAGKAAATVNKALMILGQVFAEAQLQGLCERNPARGLNVKGAKRTKQHRRAFTFDQFKALYAALCPTLRDAGWMPQDLRRDWQTFVVVAGYTGGRQQEVAHLDWSQIDLKRNVLTLARAKTGDEHWIPIHSALRTHLCLTPPEMRKGPVMPILAERQRRHISNDFRRLILPRIEIHQPFTATNKPTLGRRLAPYSIHSLRHSLATWLAAAGIEESMRMRLIGHEDATVNRGYTHAKAAQVAQALEAVPSLAQ